MLDKKFLFFTKVVSGRGNVVGNKWVNRQKEAGFCVATTRSSDRALWVVGTGTAVPLPSTNSLWTAMPVSPSQVGVVVKEL